MNLVLAYARYDVLYLCWAFLVSADTINLVDKWWPIRTDMGQIFYEKKSKGREHTCCTMLMLLPSSHCCHFWILLVGQAKIIWFGQDSELNNPLENFGPVPLLEHLIKKNLAKFLSYSAALVMLGPIQSNSVTAAQKLCPNFLFLTTKPFVRTYIQMPTYLLAP